MYASCHYSFVTYFDSDREKENKRPTRAETFHLRDALASSMNQNSKVLSDLRGETHFQIRRFQF